ncbi:MAG: hypothetical protein QGI60_03790 [archaeon]|jgi:hypothetical protein|nr:hypothetical protein [archaeon]
MSFLQLLRKPEPKKKLGICVPDHARMAREKAQAAIVSTPNGFLVSGLFAVHDSIMVQGEMVEGTAKAGIEIDCGGKNMTVTDVFVDNRPSNKIEKGDRGALFIKASSLPLVKAGDILEF